LRRQAVRILRLSTGGFLLLVGVIGGFIPILQGWVFIVAGLTVLAPESTLAQGALSWAKQKLARGKEGSAEGGFPSPSEEQRPRSVASEDPTVADEKTR
jgi:hypothetical protein